jgi:hypothetical protein
MPTFRYRAVTGIVCFALATLVACGREGQDEMSWARAALERNGSIEVVGADQQSRTFTVRLKDTGELRMVRADQVIASPAALSGSDATKTASAGKSSAAPAPAEPVPAAAEAAPSEDAAAESAVAATTSGGTASPGAHSVSYTSSSQPSSLAPQAAADVESAPGRVLESGPGYTIKAASATPSAAGRGREAGVTNAPLERRHEPIVCQGSRLLHIDNRNLAFDGDAVSAEDGCEIHITNSHISAAGIGVLVRAANVHIDNSLIEGDQASIDASEGAQVYASSTRFKGLSRRLDTATFHDLGGNIWN